MVERSERITQGPLSTEKGLWKHGKHGVSWHMHIAWAWVWDVLYPHFDSSQLLAHAVTKQLHFYDPSCARHLL